MTVKNCKLCNIEINENNSYKCNPSKCKKCHNQFRKTCKSYDHSKNPYKALTQEQKDQIQAKLDEGVSYTKLSQEVKLNHMTLRKYFKRTPKI